MNKKYTNHGGNLISSITLGENSKTYFAKKPYVYYISELQKSETMLINNLKYGSVYLLAKSVETEIIVKDSTIEDIEVGDCIQFQNTNIEIKILNGFANFLVAGIDGVIDQNNKNLIINKNKDLYKVSKPWGYEVWINGEHPAYAFKKIFIQENNKTSLQYHNLKEETNVLFEGNANLYFKVSDNVNNDNVTQKDINFTTLSGINSIHVKPSILHRIEAVTDIVLYEISTPHLDDVIRVNDDTSRPDGRIDQEHKIDK